MKKLIALLTVSLIAVFSFVGCNNVDNAANEAKELVTDASDTVSKAADEMMNNSNGNVNDNTNSGKNDGDVSNNKNVG